jgi:hypothetical protein
LRLVDEPQGIKEADLIDIIACLRAVPPLQ